VNPYQDITDPKLAKALAHPLRTRVLAALDGRTASPSELADELEVPLGVLSYHVRRLTSLGFLKLVKRVPRRGAVEHYYTAVARPRITDETWAATPNIVKQATVSAALQQIGAFVNAAAGAGGFDATESHLTRSPVTVDERGWKAIARELALMQGRISRIEDESAKRLQRAGHDGEQHATVVMMLFHSAPSESVNSHNDTQSSSSKHVERRRAASAAD
jgi:DNA-binding transcriptional ArsR family regulator